VADTGVGGCLDAVVVVLGAFDHPRVAAVAASGVEVASAGDVGHHFGQGAGLVLRGKGRRVGDPAADDAHGARELDPVGVDVGFGGRPADQGAERVMGQQVAVDFLADGVGLFRPQDLGGPAEVGFELVVAGLVFPPLVIGLRERGGGGVGGVGDGGEQGDQLAGTVAGAVGDGVLDHPHQHGPLGVEYLTGAGGVDQPGPCRPADCREHTPGRRGEGGPGVMPRSRGRLVDLRVRRRSGGGGGPGSRSSR